jgi:GGDEF domain-containing protein
LISGIDVPLEAAILLSAVCSAAGVWAGKARARLLAAKGGLPQPGAQGETSRSGLTSNTIDLALRRNARRAGSRAVLHGRIHQRGTDTEVWNAATHDDVREQIAAVMRAGLRRDDRVMMNSGNRFTVSVTGADERAAINIANRLRRKLAQLRSDQLGDGAQLDTTIGVAVGRIGDGDDQLDRRGRSALAAAVAKDADYVVSPSEIEEIMLLPAPAPSPAPSSSAA